jgi:hypothetical protein
VIGKTNRTKIELTWAGGEPLIEKGSSGGKE